MTESDVVRALGRFRDQADLRSASVLYPSGAKGSPYDPFHHAFIAGLEQRAELGRRLRVLEPRERLLLYLWYVEEWPVTAIASHLGISRMHCYRLRDRALQAMTSTGGLKPAGTEAQPASGR